MSGTSSAEGPESDRPTPEPQTDVTPSSAGHRPSRWKRSLKPVVLAVLGLGLFLWALWLYPSGATDTTSPPYTRLGISAAFPLGVIHYNVYQTSPAVAEIQISIGLPGGKLGRPANSEHVQVEVAPPPGIAFRDCRAPACTVSRPYSLWSRRLVFGSATEVTATFPVKARSFGTAYNSVSASAAIPDVIYQGPGTPTLLAGYQIPSGGSYDWSSFPTLSAGNGYALWEEPLTNGHTPARVAVGINHARQTSENNETFFAGALLGLAGGAIVSAVQEALPASD